MPARAAMEAIGHALHKDITFDAEATTVDTSPEEAFKGKRGVCQDIAHIMIACLRGVGVPAAYISGYLRTIPPPGKPRLAGADAMHAWVSAWCGAQAGWVEFDPTNDLRVATDHIFVARGRDYSDVAPLKGALRTAGAQSTKQAVDVIPLD
jgi:transglutaminase-like putative cysteine protease